MLFCYLVGLYGTCLEPFHPANKNDMVRVGVGLTGLFRASILFLIFTINSMMGSVFGITVRWWAGPLFPIFN
jgi:hypothetical protein